MYASTYESRELREAEEKRETHDVGLMVLGVVKSHDLCEQQNKRAGQERIGKVEESFADPWR